MGSTKRVRVELRPQDNVLTGSKADKARRRTLTTTTTSGQRNLDRLSASLQLDMEADRALAVRAAGLQRLSPGQGFSSTAWATKPFEECCRAICFA